MITGTTNYDDVPGVRCTLCGGYYKADDPGSHECAEEAQLEDIDALVEALEKAQQRIEELESDLSEWTDCKHDGATYYDMSGRERCGRCGADI